VNKKLFGDYFAYAELDNFACYVLADGIEDIADTESAKEAVESIIAKFQEKPSMSKASIHKYLKYANEVLLIVNTATKCGFTPQYEELEKL